MNARHIPILRFGQVYESLDQQILTDRNGEELASVSMANAGLIRADARNAAEARRQLSAMTCAELIEICKQAGELFLNETLLSGSGATTQSPEQYVEQLSQTTGLPYALVRANMGKVHHVLTEMESIINGLTRGLDLDVIDQGYGQQGGSPVSYFATTDALGVVLPSNSPGVNSIWLPCVALKVPVMLKPGREDPWTPLRIINALIAAGCPKQAFGFYPTDHAGSQTLMDCCDRSIIFGDEKTVSRYASDPAVEVHGPGWSKIIIAEDVADQWEQFIDVIAASIVTNGGRSCVNASMVIATRHGEQIAKALAKKLAEIKARPVDDPQATLASFANAQVAQWMNDSIDEGLKTAGAVEMTAEFRDRPRMVEREGRTFLLPTVVWCQSLDHPLANREFLFPYASVVELNQNEILKTIGQTLVCSAITEDEAFTERLLQCRQIDRLNVGPIATCTVQWDQPHEGNLFEFLYHRRAIQMAQTV